MRVNFTPIAAGDVEQVTREFFAPEFAAQQLGQTGRWFGLESERLGLKGPVEKPILDRLLQGVPVNGASVPGGSLRAADQPVGWKVTFEVDRRHNTLWAVGNAETRQTTELIHAMSVNATLDRMDKIVRRVAGFPAEERAGAAYASFVSGTGEGQVPGLRSTVIIPHGHRREDGSVMSFPAKNVLQSQARLSHSYMCEFVPRALYAFGRVGCLRSEIPKNLFRPLAQDRAISGPAAKDTAMVFVGEDLFVQWRRQAQLRGFGPDQVAEVLREARAQARIYGIAADFERPGTVALLKALSQKLWDVCLRPGPSTHSPNPQRGEHRPSL